MRISFPLNVYAHALLLEEGHADYLHYGLFKEGVSSIKEAQRYSADLVLQQLPPPPCKVLGIGTDLGTTLKLLTEMGYQAQGITPSSDHATYMQTLGNFTPNLGSFDAILLQESIQYIEPVVIFNQALDYLKDSGSLLIIDKFSLRDKEPVEHSLHKLTAILALAKRFSFSLQAHLDLSRYAGSTLDYLLNITEKHRDSLVTDLSVSLEQLTQLSASNKADKANYVQGYDGYALLHFKKDHLPKWQLRSFEKKYFSALQTLFKQSFKKVLSTELWQWKYAHPLAQALCTWNKDSLTGHYGGMPRDILFFGEQHTAVQIGDVMVDPTQRGALNRKGPFFMMASTFIESYIGFGKPFLLGFGFPNARAMQVAEYLGLYSPVGQMLKFSWPAVQGRSYFLTTFRVLEKKNLAQYKEDINALWQGMAKGLGQDIVGVRDYAYVHNRYNQHPENNYQFMLIRSRFTQKPQGLVIMTANDECCEIIDLICAIQQVPLLVRYAQHYTATLKCTQLACQITQSFAQYFTTSDAHHEVLDVHIASNIWSDGPTPEQIKGHWWLMSGDMDYR